METHMKVVPLSGPWTVHKKGAAESNPAMVPGCIHTDLLDAGEIEDPFYADNEKAQMWIGEADWI